MPQWSAPKRPIDYAEESLITAILNDRYAVGNTLPGERDLAAQLGITRPTLREALRRLERDGWVTIRQGKPTRVNDFWREGGPNILTAMVRYGNHLPAGFVTQVLEVRCVMAPAYTRAAVSRAPDQVVALLSAAQALADEAQAFATFDWRLHHTLTVLSGNPIYTLILNGFAGFYEETAEVYFSRPEARDVSRSFYRDLQEAAALHSPQEAADLTRYVMEKSIRLWQKAQGR